MVMKVQQNDKLSVRLQTFDKAGLKLINTMD